MVALGFLVGGWFASPVINSVLEKAKKYLGANYELQKGTQELVKTLTIKLEHCQAIVIEVEKQQIINNSALASWSARLKQAAYDAEDVFDNMEAKAIKEKVQVQGKNKVSNFASSSISSLKNLLFPDEDHNNLKKIVDQLNQLFTENHTFLTLINQNKNNESSNHQFTVQRETISQPLGEVGLYGRDEQLNLILEIILDYPDESSKKGSTSYNPHTGLLVLAIVGIGGVGKTALAQAAYNNPGVQQTFESKAWISVARNFNEIMLMRMLIQSLGGYLDLDVYTKELTSKNLSSIIDGVRFLVVLDDIFEKTEDDWAVFFATLSCAAPGSVVLITTQNQNFAHRVSSLYIALEPFESTKFWEIFKQYAFRNLDLSEKRRKTLEQIGRQIAEKLRGLPLAAKVIGNLLLSNVDENRWRKLSKSEWWDMDNSKSQILPSIGVNYENLDPYLRQCFTLCSVFPRNSLLEKDRLVQIWIAQNFIQSDDTSRRLEDIGSQWFDKLVEFSFLQPIGDKKGYVMPSLMHDLAVIVSSNDCFYLTDELVKIPLDIRHLAVDTKNIEVVKRIQLNKKLRSFFYFGFSHVNGMYGAINETLHNLDKLRVLDLSYLHMKTKIPPASIQNLQHLRFLDLSSTGIEVLTHSSFDHYHLQSLHIQKCQLAKLPRGISKLVNLRHLNADDEIVGLISEIGKLTNLQELSVYNVGKQEGHKISELKDLREITGHLKIKNCENIEIKDLEKGVKLSDKKHLDCVEILFNTERRKVNVDIEILQGLKPHPNINKLVVRLYTGQYFPNWVMQISHFMNLERVEIENTNNVEVLPPLGELPSLKHLRLELLRSVKTIDHNLYGNSQTIFPVLREFRFLRNNSFETWIIEQNREFFPHLSFLEMGDFFKARFVPLHCFSASLKTLKLLNCGVENSLKVSVNIHDLRLLEHLTFWYCPNMSIEGGIQSLANLRSFEVKNCPQLLATSQQKGKGLQVHGGEGESLQSLTSLKMDQSLLHHEFNLFLGTLPSLRLLECQNAPLKLTTQQISWFQDLTNLRELAFYDCEYEHFPINLAMMRSLKKLTLSPCAKLQSLANCVPPFLWELSLTDCSEVLLKRCQPNEGEDWPLLSHVPVIRIDGKIFHRPQISEGASGSG